MGRHLPSVCVKHHFMQLTADPLDMLEFKINMWKQGSNVGLVYLEDGRLHECFANLCSIITMNMPLLSDGLDGIFMSNLAEMN